MIQKRQYNTSVIANEALRLVVILFFITLFIFIFSSSMILKIVSLSIFIAVLALFRNPERHSEELDEHAIISVADGLVESIEEEYENKYFSNGAYKITLERTIFDTAMLRSSFKSKTKASKLISGLHLSMNSNLSNSLNKNGSIFFCSDSNKCIAVSHTCGFFGMKLFYKYPKLLQLGERYGYIIGGKVEIYLPLDTRIAVEKGDKVLAGESLLAYFTS